MKSLYQIYFFRPFGPRSAKSRIDTNNFSICPNNHCRASSMIPDQHSLKFAISKAYENRLSGNLIIILRFEYLNRHKLKYPLDMELPNLCLFIKDGKLTRAFYSNSLTHIIKKQNYFIQILN